RLHDAALDVDEGDALERLGGRRRGRQEGRGGRAAEGQRQKERARAHLRRTLAAASTAGKLRPWTPGPRSGFRFVHAPIAPAAWVRAASARLGQAGGALRRT